MCEEEYELAIEECHKALELDPKNIYARENLMWAYYHMKDFERAREQGEALVAIEPSAINYNSIASVHFCLQDYESAIEAYRKSLELNPKNGDARRYLIYALSLSGIEEATAEEILKVYPTAKARFSLVLESLRYLLPPFVLLAILFVLSRDRRISTIFCDSPGKQEEIISILGSILLIFLAYYILPYILINPLGPNYFDRMITAIYFHGYPSAKISKWFITSVIAFLILPIYLMKRNGIPLIPFFTINVEKLKKIIAHTFLGIALWFGLSIPLGIILMILNKSEAVEEASRQLKGFQNFSLLVRICGSTFFPFIEEICFRGMILSMLKKHFKPIFSVIFSALLFTMLHYSFPLYSLPYVFIEGIILAYLVHKTQSLWPSIILHALVNYYNFFLW